MVSVMSCHQQTQGREQRDQPAHGIGDNRGKLVGAPAGNRRGHQIAQDERQQRGREQYDEVANQRIYAAALLERLCETDGCHGCNRKADERQGELGCQLQAGKVGGQAEDAASGGVTIIRQLAHEGLADVLQGHERQNDEGMEHDQQQKPDHAR